MRTHRHTQTHTHTHTLTPSEVEGKDTHDGWSRFTYVSVEKPWRWWCWRGSTWLESDISSGCCRECVCACVWVRPLLSFDHKGRGEERILIRRKAAHIGSVLRWALLYNHWGYTFSHIYLIGSTACWHFSIISINIVLTTRVLAEIQLICRYLLGQKYQSVTCFIQTDKLRQLWCICECEANVVGQSSTKSNSMLKTRCDLFCLRPRSHRLEVDGRRTATFAYMWLGPKN